MDRFKNAERPERIRDAADQAYRSTANLQILLEASPLAEYARQVDRLASELDALQVTLDAELTRVGV